MIKFKDVPATLYTYFLILMIIAQIVFIYDEFIQEKIVYLYVHILILIYFIFRLYILHQLKNKANKNNKTLIEYLEELSLKP